MNKLISKAEEWLGSMQSIQNQRMYINDRNVDTMRLIEDMLKEIKNLNRREKALVKIIKNLMPYLYWATPEFIKQFKAVSNPNKLQEEIITTFNRFNIK